MLMEEMRHHGGKLELEVKTPQRVQQIVAEKVLLSVGRVPNLDLNFSKAHIKTSLASIQVNRRMETAVSNVYAIGGTLLAHVAMEEGTVAAENAVGIHRRMEE